MEEQIQQTIITGIDPHIGYNYSRGSDFPLMVGESFHNGYIKLNTSDNTSNGIAVLGGSTSDISYDGSWLRPFRELLSKNGFDVPLFSGAVSGYSSNQEVFKLIRDILPLSPKIVISFNGVNDLWHIQSTSPTHPMVHSYQNRLFQHLLPNKNTEKEQFFDSFKNVSGAVAFNDNYPLSSVNLGTQSKLTPSQNWYKNSQLMYAICKQFNIQYINILQPVIGAGAYHLNEIEKKFFEQKCREWVGYEQAIKDFFYDARSYATSHEYIHDFVDIFSDCRDMYGDIRHPNKSGNEIIAQAVSSLIYPHL